MLFKRIVSEGLSHFSYLLGDGGEAVVIDPRRDCDIYIEEALRQGVRLTHVLETHRNEDYVAGSVELASRTGAEIWHADSQLDYGYGQAVEDGRRWRLGHLRIEAVPTPGHTPGSMSYLLRDPGGEPWMVFSGDTLFAGDVGRVDLIGMEQAEELAGDLYDSIFRRLLPLGDGVLLFPAHGAGSVCGSSIASRAWTTLGLERKLNPRLQAENKEAFVRAVARELERPPYFSRMEKWNVEGPPLLGSLSPAPLTPAEFGKKKTEGQVLDTRMELSFGSAHIPGSLSIWRAGISGFAGWFLSYERPVLLVGDGDDPMDLVRILVRMGYDDISGYLSGGLHSWLTHGLPIESVMTLSVQELCRVLDSGGEAWILDVRSQSELDREGAIPGAHHVHITQLPRNTSIIPKERLVHIFCGSGLRSMTAASLLKIRGWEHLAVVLGGFAGWTSITCPIRRPGGQK